MSVYLWEARHLWGAAQRYENKTGIKVNIQNNYILPDPDNYDSFDPQYAKKIYVEQALTSLMTGSGADIYDVRYLEFDHLGKNGLLVDMGDWLENDPGLTDDIVFRDILLSEKTENGIFAMPIDFTFRKLKAAYEDVPLLENKRMNWQEFFDIVSELDLVQDRAYADNELGIFRERFISGNSYYIDEEGNKLNYEAVIALLEECRDWRDMGLCADSKNDINAYLDNTYAYLYGMVGYHDLIAEPLCTLPEEYTRVSYGYFPGSYFAPMLFDGDPVIKNGKKLYPEISDRTGRYGVNADSPNAEVAQDFLRFLLSEEEQEEIVYKNYEDSGGIHNGFYIPVSRAAFRNMVDRDLERVKAWNRNVVLDKPPLIKEAEDAVDEIAYIIMEKPYHETIIFDLAKQFFLGEISAEEAARQMSDKVGLYLKELG